MNEIRERLEEIRRLAEKWRGGEVLADDIVWEIHEDATKALALLEKSEPVAWKTWCAECESIYVVFDPDDDECHVCGCTLTDPSPLFASPTPTEATLSRVEELEELRDWVLLYDDAIREGEDADAVFHDMVKSARALTGQEEDANG